MRVAGSALPLDRRAFKRNRQFGMVRVGSRREMLRGALRHDVSGEHPAFGANQALAARQPAG